MDKQGVCEVIENKQVALDTMQLLLQYEPEQKSMWPGRFVHIRPFGREDLILRRPISVNYFDAEKKRLSLVYQVKGEGTQSIVQAKPGDRLDVFGPTGNGFFLPKDAKNIWSIGGGLGVAPLRYLPVHYKDVTWEAILGFRNADCVYQRDAFEEVYNQIALCTDDGSAGTKGFVTDVLLQRLRAGERPDAIFACGPTPMVRALQKALEDYKDIPCRVSLEQRMGCGMGACYVCTCAMEKDGERRSARVCVDGPVFDIWEVV